MKVSIIIPTYNRTQHLKNILNDIVSVDNESVLEVLVCDDGSTEDVASIVNNVKYSKPVYHLRQDDLGFRAGQARNMGINRAKGDILLFLDDDVRISKFFIDAHISRHKQMKEKSLVFGFRYRSVDQVENIHQLSHPSESWGKDSRAFEIDETDVNVSKSAHPWFYVYSCNFSVRNVPGLPIFDPTFEGWGMEDIELAYRLYYHDFQLCYEPKAWLLHIESKLPRDPFRCEEMDTKNVLEKNYNTYVKNCMRFMQKYPQDQILRELIKTDLSWYVLDNDKGWVKNGHLNDFGDVLKAYTDGVPVKKEIVTEIMKDYPKLFIDSGILKLEDKSLLSRPLDEIAIELTVYCNLKCEMCSVWELKKHGISNERAKLMLEEARSLGAKTFIPCGAESFMRKDFLEIVEFAHNLGYTRQEIVTNGLMLTDKIIERLSKIDSVYLHVSIDGPKFIHDRLRGEGSFDDLMVILEKLKAAGIKFGISAVIMRETLPFLRTIIDLAKLYEVEEISMQPFQFEISGTEKDTKRFSFLKENEPYLIHELGLVNDYAKARGIKLFTEALFHTIPDYLINHKRPIPPQGCHMPSRFVLIDHNGEMYPCFFMRDVSMGNANKDSLKGVWHSMVHNKMQEIALTKTCPGCLAACSDIASFNESLNQTVSYV
jgi:MoaA/NifB/PqqE/SkfB family radical SAM enzyme/glycosyltransferase involved in cell wall biosynthesis